MFPNHFKNRTFWIYLHILLLSGLAALHIHFIAVHSYWRTTVYQEGELWDSVHTHRWSLIWRVEEQTVALVFPSEGIFIVSVAVKESGICRALEEQTEAHTAAVDSQEAHAAGMWQEETCSLHRKKTPHEINTHSGSWSDCSFILSKKIST